MDNSLALLARFCCWRWWCTADLVRGSNPPIIHRLCNRLGRRVGLLGRRVVRRSPSGGPGPLPQASELLRPGPNAHSLQKAVALAAHHSAGWHMLLDRSAVAPARGGAQAEGPLRSVDEAVRAAPLTPQAATSMWECTSLNAGTLPPHLTTLLMLAELRLQCRSPAPFLSLWPL